MHVHVLKNETFDSDLKFYWNIVINFRPQMIKFMYWLHGATWSESSLIDFSCLILVLNEVVIEFTDLLTIFKFGF